MHYFFIILNFGKLLSEIKKHIVKFIDTLLRNYCEILEEIYLIF